MDERAPQRLIDDAFRGVMTGVAAAMDELIAFRQLRDQGTLTVPYGMSVEEARNWLTEVVSWKVTQIAADRRLTSEAKVKALRLTDGETLLGLFQIRNCLEHHHGIATRDLTLSLRRLEVRVDNQAIEELPAEVAEGQTVGVGVVTEKHHYKTGQRVELSEAQVDALPFTLMTLLQDAVTSMTSPAL